MTLVLGMINADYAVQLADRRLSANGVPVDDEADKGVVLHCRNGRFAVGFSGLAKAGTFDTHLWLIDALAESAPPEYTALELTQRFVERANSDFAALPALRRLPPKDKRLSFMFTGYVAQPTGPAMVALLVSNFQDFETGEDYEEASIFRSRYFSVRPDAGEPRTWIQRIGMWPALDPNDVPPLRRLLGERRPVRAVIDKGVDIVRKAASNTIARNGIGLQVSAIVIPADFSEPPTSDYQSAHNTTTTYFASVVVAQGDDRRMRLRDFRLEAVTPGAGPIVVPRVGRNDPCPCGSEKKYKWCHGSHRRPDVGQPEQRRSI